MSVSGERPTALLLSPHPDDELLGCPAHLFALRDAGWRIVNLALSLGSDRGRQERRRDELESACARAGFELRLPPTDPPGSWPLPTEVAELAESLGTDLLVAPSPHDDHPAHERAGRLALSAVRAGAAPRLWLWGLWADVGLPNSLCLFDIDRLEQIEHALQAHGGELERNDYRRLLRARAEAGATLLAERVFGHGSAGTPAGQLAEGLCDIVIGPHGELWLSAPSQLDPARFPIARQPATIRLERWLDRPSIRTVVGEQGDR